eukprot:scaffold772_cov339-Pavlova_lutheri.AAC.76
MDVRGPGTQEGSVSTPPPSTVGGRGKEGGNERKGGEARDPSSATHDRQSVRRSSVVQGGGRAPSAGIRFDARGGGGTDGCDRSQFPSNEREMQAEERRGGVGRGKEMGNRHREKGLAHTWGWIPSE